MSSQEATAPVLTPSPPRTQHPNPTPRVTSPSKAGAAAAGAEADAAKRKGTDGEAAGAQQEAKKDAKDGGAAEPKDAKADGAAGANLMDRLKLNTLKDKIKENAAVLNEHVKTNAAQLRERLGAHDSDEDDEESSDEEIEESWFGASVTPTTDSSTTVAATATTVRSRPPPSFISEEEEKTIKEQLKSTKALRKRLRRLRKLTKSSLKHLQESNTRLENLVSGVATATEGPCTDPGIQRLAATAASNLKTFKETSAFELYKEKLMKEIVEQVKPLTDHSKYVSLVGKERRVARDKRVKQERGELDVSDEAAYQRSVEIAKTYDEKNDAYKDEYRSFVEHNSSQLGQMLKCYLVESASFYERIAKVLRESADSVATDPNKYLTEEAVTKFKDYVPPRTEPTFTAPALFGGGNTSSPSHTSAAAAAADDRLTVKPSARMRDDAAVNGIPLADPDATADRRRSKAYSTSAYLRHEDGDTDVSRTRLAISDFLRTGELADSSAPARQSELPMSAIHDLQENYGIEWPIKEDEREDPRPGANSPLSDDAQVDNRSLTPTDTSILPSLARRGSQSYGSSSLR